MNKHIIIILLIIILTNNILAQETTGADFLKIIPGARAIS